MMFIASQNQLAIPSALEVPNYEDRLSQFKRIVIDHVAASDPDMAAEIELTLANEAELSTKILEACTLVLQTFLREINEDALQMFAYWSEGDALDVKVSDMGLKRQVIDEGDPDAFPPVDPTYEGDDQLRTRYYLAPHGFSNAGPRLSYKYHAMTLDEKPLITVESPESNVLTVTYKFEQGAFAGQVKDADGIRTAPGRVNVPILAHDGDGTPSAELIAAAQEYFERDDVAVETDTITVVPAEILPYTINAIAYIDRGPDAELTKESGELALAEYANDQRRLKGVIDPGMIGHLLYGIGAKKVDVLSPSNEISASRSQAPYCQSIAVEVRVRDE